MEPAPIPVPAAKSPAKQLFPRRMAIALATFVAGTAFLIYARFLLGKVVDEMMAALFQPDVVPPHSTLPALMLACKYSGFFLAAAGLGYAVYAMAAQYMGTNESTSSAPKPLVAWKYFLGVAALIFAAAWQFGKFYM